MFKIVKKSINNYYKKQLKKIISLDIVKTYIELETLIKNGDYNSIIVGSSHGEYGIKAEILSDKNNKYLNCATTSQDLYRSYELIKNINHIKKIKRVIMTYSLFSNGFLLDKTKDGIKDCYLSDVFLNIKTNAAYTDNDIHILNLIRKYAKTYTIENYYYKNTFGDKINNYYFMVNISAEQRVGGHIKHNRRNNNLNGYIEKTVHYCKENNIELIIIVTPVRDDYIAETNKYGDYQTHYKNLIDITFKNNIPLLFYDNKVMKYDDFGDFDHLTNKGAYKFTSILKDDINKI